MLYNNECHISRRKCFILDSYDDHCLRYDSLSTLSRRGHYRVVVENVQNKNLCQENVGFIKALFITS